MKLRILIVTISIIFTLLFAVFQIHLSTLDYQEYDVINVNDIVKQIEKDLEKESISRVEEKYSCKIILKEDKDYNRELYSAINKGELILDYYRGEELIGKIILPGNSASFVRVKQKLSIALWTLLITLLFAFYLIIFFLYIRILKPFYKLKRFAQRISVGNLDIPLTMDKNNYFGAFTESFDLMREELKKAKQGEYEANISKKELVAGLSHDIKTPVATIKALCEVLEVKLKDSENLAKIATINQKADVIDKLISNMFEATLEELEVLKIEPREELSTIITPMFQDSNLYGKIHIMNELPGCLIKCDKLRLNQVIDNVINNSYKYPNTDIEVTYRETKEHIQIDIRDYGDGTSKVDIPLVFEKFYRGENAAQHVGSGLGLYLSRLFMEGMEGGIDCYEEHGFVVVLTIKKV